MSFLEKIKTVQTWSAIGTILVVAIIDRFVISRWWRRRA